VQGLYKKKRGFLQLFEKISLSLYFWLLEHHGSSHESVVLLLSTSIVWFFAFYEAVLENCLFLPLQVQTYLMRSRCNCLIVSFCGNGVLWVFQSAWRYRLLIKYLLAVCKPIVQNYIFKSRFNFIFLIKGQITGRRYFVFPWYNRTSIAFVFIPFFIKKLYDTLNHIFFFVVLGIGIWVFVFPSVIVTLCKFHEVIIGNLVIVGENSLMMAYFSI